MLNSKGERELAYLVKIDDITPINDYDRVELAHVGGWTVVVGKGEFKPGNIAVYFEIDSQLPNKPPFSEMQFLASKHFKIETQKMCKGTVYSQGFLCTIEQLGWENQGRGYVYDPESGDHGLHYIYDERRFVTKDIGVTYVVKEDNKRKASSRDKYKRMAQRHPNLFKKPIFKWLMRRSWGKKFLFIFFGKKKDKRTDWPSWVKKTDEERIQNLPHLLKNKETHWIATEKIDGSSTTFAIKRKKGLGFRYDFYVCSRNVVFDKPDKSCFYDTNIYLEMAQKYDIENKLIEMLEDLREDWIYIQGETYGKDVQKRDYALKDHDFKAFNLVTSKKGRWNSVAMATYLDFFEIPSVPIINQNYILPDTIEEFCNYVDSAPSAIDGKMREGIVCRTADGTTSFKCVSPRYLLKYH